MRVTSLLDDEVFLHRVAQMLVREGKSVQQIKSALSSEYSDLTPQMIYRAISVLGEKGVVSYNPKRESDLEEALAEKFKIARSAVHVVKFAQDVPLEAARIAKDILSKEWRDRGRRPSAPIGLGLGPGRTTAQMTSELGRLLTSTSKVRLKLFALAGGAPADHPEMSPISFFSEIPEAIVLGRVGLFAPNLVEVGHFENLKTSPGVKEAFTQKKEVFLSVTSMGDAADERDLLSRFLLAQSAEALSGISRKGYVGNIQYRPYSKGEPIVEEEDDFRAVTLFEIDEMVELASRRDHHIILMVLNKSRESIQPLLANEELRAFSEIVIDGVTAATVCE